MKWSLVKAQLTKLRKLVKLTIVKMEQWIFALHKQIEAVAEITWCKFFFFFLTLTQDSSPALHFLFLPLVHILLTK